MRRIALPSWLVLALTAALVVAAGERQGSAQAARDSRTRPAPAQAPAIGSDQAKADAPKPERAAPARSESPRADAAPDRSTPRRTMEGFSRATSSNDYARAAQYLDLRALPRARQGDGPELARKLGEVIDYKLLLDMSKLSDDVAGEQSDTQSSQVVATIELDGDPVPVAVSRVRLEDGTYVWLIAKSTVAMVPSLYAAYGPGPLADRVPRALSETRILRLGAWQWLGLTLAIAAAAITAWLVAAVLASIARFFARRAAPRWGAEFVAAGRAPGRLLIATLVYDQLLEPLHLTAQAQLIAGRVTSSLAIAGLAWLVIRAVYIGANAIEGRLPEDTVGELRTRGVRTQLVVMRKIVSIAVGLVSTAIILLQFDFVRNVGVSLLASAGIAGLLVGFAAQKTLGAVLAGVQLSITQPVRIGDAVVIEGEFGHVEEIKLTYLVVRIWDNRRLVVPIGRFLEQPFQNWTKTSSDLLGVVTLTIDYATPLDGVRKELERLCRENAAWDGKECRLQVTDMTDKVLVVRALVSAPDAGRMWDLRCDIREGLVKYVQSLEVGAYLPRIRSEAAAAKVAQGLGATKTLSALVGVVPWSDRCCMGCKLGRHAR